MAKAHGPIVYNPDEMNLLLPMNSQAYEHMLRSQDVAPVQAVVAELRNRDILCYLGGGVTRQAVLSGDKRYGDVDILAVYNNLFCERNKFMELLDAANHNKEPVLMGNQSFQVETSIMRDAYMKIYSGIRRTAKLQPVRTLGQVETSELISQIDLTFIGKSLFKELFW